MDVSAYATLTNTTIRTVVMVSPQEQRTCACTLAIPTYQPEWYSKLAGYHLLPEAVL